MNIMEARVEVCTDSNDPLSDIMLNGNYCAERMRISHLEKITIDKFRR